MSEEGYDCCSQDEVWGGDGEREGPCVSQPLLEEPLGGREMPDK